MDKTEINKTENEYISKHLAPLIEKGVITDVKEGDHSKIFFDLSKRIKRMRVSCLLEPSYKGVFIVFQLLEKSKGGDGFTPLFYDVATLPIPNPNEDYYKLVKFIPERAAFCLANISDFKNQDLWDIWQQPHSSWWDEMEIEVIGNKFDNPELLEE